MQKTIHIGNLLSSTSEEELRQLLSQCAVPQAIKLAGDPSYPSRFAFAEFLDTEQASAAVQIFNGLEFKGQHLKVALSKTPLNAAAPNKDPRPPAAMPMPTTFGDPLTRTVYIAGVDSSLPEQHVADFFAYCGTMTNYKLCGDTSHPTRFAFIEFATNESARRAISLSGTFLGSSALRISMSKTAMQSQHGTKSAISTPQRDGTDKTIHVGNLDTNTSEEDLKKFFASCGPISKVVLTSDSSGYKFAFVEYQLRESAISALKMNGKTFNNRALRVSPSRSAIASSNKHAKPPQQQYYQNAATTYAAYNNAAYASPSAYPVVNNYPVYASPYPVQQQQPATPYGTYSYANAAAYSPASYSYQQYPYISYPSPIPNTTTTQYYNQYNTPLASYDGLETLTRPVTTSETTPIATTLDTKDLPSPSTTTEEIQQPKFDSTEEALPQQQQITATDQSIATTTSSNKRKREEQEEYTDAVQPDAKKIKLDEQPAALHEAS